MTTTVTLETLRIIRLALYQLRQDVGVPETVAEATADTSTLWTKCKDCFDVAFAEVLNAHNWTWKRNATAAQEISTKPDNWPDDAKNALVYVTARELAIPVAGRVEDLKTCAEIGNMKCTKARITDLTSELAANTDPVLARLVANFRNDDAGLVNAFTVYTNRASSVKTACDKEVKMTLGITAATLDDLAQECSNSLAVARLCRVCGMEANDEQLLLQEYHTKIAEWRKVKLNEALAANTDPVLARLVANFRNDDAGLVNAFTVYTNRASSVKTACESEINNAHAWATAFDWDSQSAQSHVAYPAWLMLCVSRLTLSCGKDANEQTIQEQEYSAILRQARIADLESAKASITDADTKEVLSTILGIFTDSNTTLPRSMTEITSRIDAIKSHVREKIIAAHNWSFCRDEAMTEACTCDPGDGNYPFACELPPKCVRPLECYDQAGRKADWKIVGHRIRSVYPISSVLYIRNEDRLDRWPPLCRSAYVSLIAADVAATVAGSSSEAQRLRQIYERDLETAKLADSRGTGSRREAHGRNFYADAMLRNSRSLYPGGPKWR